MFLGAGAAYAIFAYGVNKLAEHLLHFRLDWGHAVYLRNLLTMGGFIFTGGVTASCAAARLRRRGIDLGQYVRVSTVVAVCLATSVSLNTDLSVLAGGRYDELSTEDLPAWFAMAKFAVLVGTVALGWVLWRGARRHGDDAARSRPPDAGATDW